MNILMSFCVLLLAQCAGEALRTILHLPLPGPVLGMALLTLVLLLRRRDPEAALVQTSNALLQWLGLLFVPAGVGVVVYLDLLRHAWIPIAAALSVSTALTFAVTALVMQVLQRRAERVA